MRRIFLLGLALAFTLGACGGDDSKSDSAAESSPAAQSARPGAENSSEAESQAGVASGNGGASATDAQHAAGNKRKVKRRTAAPAEPDSGKSTKPAQKKPRTPSEHLATLSPAERRKLERDIYEQGKNVCTAQGPKEIAKSYKFPSTDPETVARLYARAYEQGIPALALPFQQGCLAGFKRYARNPKA